MKAYKGSGSEVPGIFHFDSR